MTLNLTVGKGLFIATLFSFTNIDSVLGFYVGTGFGLSMKIDGSLYTGDRGNAGEIGHIKIPNETGICGCGKTGCLETIASGIKLIKILVIYV